MGELILLQLNENFIGTHPRVTVCMQSSVIFLINFNMLGTDDNGLFL